MLKNLEKGTMWISNELFGMTHFMSCWTQFMFTQKLGCTLNVLMRLCATCTLQSWFFWLIMKNSMSDHYVAYAWLNLLFGFCVRCFMALIRGVKSKFPCPVCLVPHTQMCDGSTHPLHTAESMQKVYEEAQEMESSADWQKHLKQYGLHNVKVQRIHLTMTSYWILHLAEYILESWEFWSTQVTFIWLFA